MKRWSYCILSVAFLCALYQPPLTAGPTTPTRKVKVAKILNDRNDWTITAQDTPDSNPTTIYGSVKISRSTNPGFGLPIPTQQEFYIKVDNAELFNSTTKIKKDMVPRIKSIELPAKQDILLVTHDGTYALNRVKDKWERIEKKGPSRKVKVTKLNKKDKGKLTITSYAKGLEYGRVVITSSTNPGRGLPIPKQGDFSIDVYAPPNLRKITDIEAKTTPTIKSIEIQDDRTAQIVTQ